MEYLETVEIEGKNISNPFRMPVQWVNRPNLDFRGYCGMIASGKIEPGDNIRILPGGKNSTVKSILFNNEELEIATSGRSVTIILEDEIDVSRGNIIVSAENPGGEADQFQAHILWLSDDAMMPGRQYIFKSNSQTASLNLGKLKYQINVNTLNQVPAKDLKLNQIAVCNISLDKRIAFDSYKENKTTGGFIIIDKITNHTVGMGLIDFALRRSDNIHWQSIDITKEQRALQKTQSPKIIWFTGLSGSGKSSIANILEKKLHSMGLHTIILDGDNIRHGLNKDLGFTEADRVENIRRVGEVAKLMVESGLICITAFISPFESERRMIRSLVTKDEFVEIYVDTPLEICEERDVKGLYAKARAGQLPNFTGISSPFEEPKNPEIRIDTIQTSPEVAADIIIDFLSKNHLT